MRKVRNYSCIAEDFHRRRVIIDSAWLSGDEFKMRVSVSPSELLHRVQWCHPLNASDLAGIT